jgi:hypothetical protein
VRDRVGHPGDIVDDPVAIDTGFAVGALGPREGAVRDRHELHAGSAVDDLVGDAAAHEAGADHGHPHGPALRSAGLQRVVDQDHARGAVV